LGEYPWQYITEQDELLGNRERRVYPSPYIPVTIFSPKRGTRLAAMVDSGAVINMISKALCNSLGFLMQDASEYNMCPVQGPISGLDRVVDNVTISVGGLSYDISFFVISEANHYCILRQPFIIISRIRLSGTPNRIDDPEYTELYNKKRRKIL
jgi:hypothetical protein